MSSWRAEVNKELENIKSNTQKIADLETKTSILPSYPDLSNVKTDANGFTISGNLSVRGNSWDGNEYKLQWLEDDDEAYCPSGYFVAGIKIKKLSPANNQDAPINKIQFFCREL